MLLRSFAAVLVVVAGRACAFQAAAPTPPPPPPVRLPLPPAVAPVPVAAPVAAAAAKAYAMGDHYTKRHYLIPMRDGVKLYTQVYSPKDTSKAYPFMMTRTPYSVGPYEDDKFPDVNGTAESLAKDGYIIVRQDVRGTHMSEGEFVNMTPHRAVKGPKDTDESTDTFDTIEWLLANVEGHNGRVGQWGISYPGFYCSAGMIDAHPALRAVSPQAPIADWYFDDFYHHGAFFLPHAFNFFSGFGKPRPAPTTSGAGGFSHPTPDGYRFFLDLGSLRNVNEKHFKGEIAFWNDIVAHPAYDEFWKARNLLPHLKRVAPAVLVVGGWFDAEDLYGALNTYRAIETQNPGVANTLVMGPWGHGDWGRRDGRSLGNIDFGSETSAYFQDTIQLPFFRKYLKDDATTPPPEAFVFETGANQWRSFPVWPPAEVTARTFYPGAGGVLALEAVPGVSGVDEFVSDPAKPVPSSEVIDVGLVREYMTDDQRFAARRPDVLAYESAPLTQDLTLAGPIVAELVVSTSLDDADWVVKLIDVFPGSAKDPPSMGNGKRMGDYQMMVRSEAIRGRYRESYSDPKPFKANEPTPVRLEMQDVLHTFKAGHRVMIQIQSTWFPMMDRNPQKWVENIFEAADGDFTKATHRVYLGDTGTKIRVGVIPTPPPPPVAPAP